MKKSKTGEVLNIPLLKRVIVFAKPYKTQFIIAAISAIILSFLAPARPMLINYAIDNYILIEDASNLLRITIILISLLFLEGFIQFFYMYLSNWIGQHVILDLRKKIFKHILCTFNRCSISSITALLALLSLDLFLILKQLQIFFLKVY